MEKLNSANPSLGCSVKRLSRKESNPSPPRQFKIITVYKAVIKINQPRAQGKFEGQILSLSRNEVEHRAEVLGPERDHSFPISNETRALGFLH